MKRDGRWTGLSIELWRDIAQRMNVAYRFVPERTVDSLLNAVQHRKVDVGIGALSITEARDKLMDFTYPVIDGGLGIATTQQNGGFLASVKAFLSWRFVSAVGILLAVLLGAGILVWAFERRRNAEQFGGHPLHGIGHGLWWSAVTMTTVGYGDKAPMTLAGRIIGLIWMFVSVITISGFTAAIASSVTLSQLQPKVSGAQDLPRVRVATVAGTSAAGYLAEKGLGSRGYPTPVAALHALQQNKADAVVFDAPLLRYLIRQGDARNVVVLDQPLRKEQYGFAIPTGSHWRERINLALLAIQQSPQWPKLVNKYLGQR